MMMKGTKKKREQGGGTTLKERKKNKAEGEEQDAHSLFCLWRGNKKNEGEKERKKEKRWRSREQERKNTLTQDTSSPHDARPICCQPLPSLFFSFPFLLLPFLFSHHCIDYCTDCCVSFSLGKKGYESEKKGSHDRNLSRK